MFESSRGGSSFCGDSDEFVAVNRMGEYCFLMLFVLLCWNMSNQELLDE